jgi:hypothetical protein
MKHKLNHAALRAAVTTRLRVGQSGTLIPAGSRTFSILYVAHTDSEAHSATNSMGPVILFRTYSDWGVRPTTHLHPERRLRMSGAIPLLLLYALMEWTLILLYMPRYAGLLKVER